MQNELLIKRNNEIFQQSNQIDLNQYDDLQETNKQLLILNKQLLKGKEKAEDRNRLKSEFLANMVHEIRTPMSAIKSFAEFLQAPDLTEEDKVQYAQIIYQCTDDLLSLVNDLLDVSKIEAGQLAIIESPCNLKDLFNELFELFDASARQYKSGTVQLKSHFELNHEQCMVNADFIRLKQVLVNLISNALKFTINGHVLFGCRLIDNKTLQFYVEDTGIGIKPEMQNVIFERYKQISDPYTVNQCKGTGLGLSIVKSLVGLMKGKVWVESTEGIGSTFYFTLPYKKSTTPKTRIKNSASYN